MNIPITEAKAQLTELVRRAENGETIVLTRHGRPAARIVPEQPVVNRRPLDRKLIDEISRHAVAEMKPGDWEDIYDESGLPR